MEQFSFFEQDTHPAEQPPVHQLAIIGGRLEDTNLDIFNRMLRCAGGKIGVLATASSEPEETGAETVLVFQSYGFEAEYIPIQMNNCQTSAFDPTVVAQLDRLGSVYFTGGDQAHIVSSLIQDGKETPALTKIRELFARGGLIAGSSAGAAVMSNPMIMGGHSLEAVVYGVATEPAQPGLLVGQGLGFFPFGVVDQHFIKRGRLGRLIVAMQAAGGVHGFGVDENTAMFVSNDRLDVVGELGAFIVDQSRAHFSEDGQLLSGIRVSYLDHGDAYDLTHRLVIPNLKKKVREADAGFFKAPAFSRKNIFGSYAIYELMVRLMEGDQSCYVSDQGNAYDPASQTEVTVQLQREATTGILTCLEGLDYRYTAIDFSVLVSKRQISPAARRREERALKYTRKQTPPGELSPNSRLILLGSGLSLEDIDIINEIKRYATTPVGIIATANEDPAQTAHEYTRLFKECGLESVFIDLTAANVETQRHNPELIDQIAALKMFVLTGGNQKRLVETLLHRGEETPVYRALLSAYQQGATIIAVSGSASALSSIMIAGGDSYDAFRYGVSLSEHASGIVLEQGLGLFEPGIIDQNILRRNRLGRLIVASVEEAFHFGFGICEHAALVVEPQQPLRVIGKNGLVLVEIDDDHLRLQADDFAVHNLKITLVSPGETIDLTTGVVFQPVVSKDHPINIHTILSHLARDCGATLTTSDQEPLPPIHFNMVPTDNPQSALLSVMSLRG